MIGLWAPVNSAGVPFRRSADHSSAFLNDRPPHVKRNTQSLLSIFPFGTWNTNRAREHPLIQRMTKDYLLKLREVRRNAAKTSLSHLWTEVAASWQCEPRVLAVVPHTTSAHSSRPTHSRVSLPRLHRDLQKAKGWGVLWLPPPLVLTFSCGGSAGAARRE